MRKILLVSLLLIALPLYGYNVFLLLRVALPSKKDNKEMATAGKGASFESVLKAAAPVVFAEKGKDPFILYKEKPKPVVKKTVRKKVAKKEVKPPAITVTGIMWNPSNPVAMVKLPGGKSTLAKAGQQLDGNITVKKVEKKSITVVYEGQVFTIGRK